MSAERGATGAAGAFGELAAGIDEASAPPAVRRRLRAVVADVLATAVAAAGRPDVAAARRAVLAGEGPSTVIGERRGAAPALAALANALPIASEQRQDGHRLARGHPGAHVVPAVLAVAEAAGASGPATLSAVLAGYEVGARVGLAMGGTPPGVHDIGTWGTVGAAAGVAHLLAASDAGAVATAVELAAALPMLPSAELVFAGADGQHLLLGTAVAHAVVCGQAAAAGLAAPAGSLEGHFARWSAAAWHLGPPVPGWTILDGYLKRHPTCAHLHGVNDAVEDLVAQGPLAAERIAAVEVRTYAAAAAFGDPRPANELAARFSIPWTVAAGLARGGLDDGAFGPATLADPDLRALAGRVSVRADPGLEAGYPAGRPAVVTVRLDDGSTRRARADRPRGDGPEALDDADVRSKPRRLLEPRLGRRGAERLLEAVDRLADDGLGPLTARLRDAAART